MPERTEEQGETVRLKDTGEVTEEGCTGDHLFSLSEPSERMDSLDEAGVGKMSAVFVGLVLSSVTDTLRAKKPELTSGSPAGSRHWVMPLCLPTTVSIEAVPAASTWLSIFSD